ncbi:MAG: hypothetical protein ACO265_08570 [Polynucleobacter sp.]|jgi:hypothetical protein
MPFRDQYKAKMQPKPDIVEVVDVNFNHWYHALFAILVALALLPLVLPRSQSALGVLRDLQSVYLSALMIVIAVMMASSSLYACYQACKLQANLGKDALADACSGSEIHSLLHLVIITVYREPLDLITLTLDSLANQTKARSLAVTLAFEQDSPNLEANVAAIQLLFADSFYRLFIFVHPNGLFGETQGKCSNLNYAARSTVAALSKEMSLDFKKTTITSCDADNLFCRKYFEILESSYLNRPDRLSTMWQAPLVYSWGLDVMPIFTYITGVLRSIWIVGILIPLGLNGMSVFSLSLDLYHRGGYTSSIYQMEDILSTIRWSILTGSKVKLSHLKAPILSGPTSGKNLFEQFTQWRDQITRWTIGAAEVYAYALHYSRQSSLSVFSLTTWLLCFFLFYFILQCAAPVALTIGFARVSLFDSNLTYTHLFMSDDTLASFFRWWLLSLFVINAVVAWAVCLLSQGIGIKENIVAVFAKLIFAPPVMALSSLISLVALGRVALYGKAACVHIPSAKGSLPTNIQLH